MSLLLRVPHVRPFVAAIAACCAVITMVSWSDRSVGAQSAGDRSEVQRPAQPAEPSPGQPSRLRVATFNIAMGLNEGELAARLQREDDPGLRKVAAIIQRVRPDVLLLNELDDSIDTKLNRSTVDRVGLLQRNYLARGQFGEHPIRYDYSFSAPVNTGLPSGVDLDGDGRSDGPGDAQGFGRFHGQYSMLVLSRYPVLESEVRTWQKLLWRDLPGARLPNRSDGNPWYSAAALDVLRLSSKSHWDVPIRIQDQTIHFLVAHPTPPVFDGPEDRNGLRNRDEIALLANLIDPRRSRDIHDDQGRAGGLPEDALFVIAGDMNADPLDGDSALGAVDQLLKHPLINNFYIPVSEGARYAAQRQGGSNRQHRGDPAAATADFNDESGPGNLRIDYVLPSRELVIDDGGVFWPRPGEPGAEWIDVSDHRLVWIDVIFPSQSPSE